MGLSSVGLSRRVGCFAAKGLKEGSLRGRTFATSIPSVPGRILFNAEIPSKHREPFEDWAKNSKLNLDLLMLQDNNDPPIIDKGVTILSKSTLRLEEHSINAIVCWLYRSNDRFNREFWDEQMRRLSDIIAEEYFDVAKSPSVYLMAHHAIEDDIAKDVVEIDDHRLVTSVDGAHFFRHPFSPRTSLQQLDNIIDDERTVIEGSDIKYYSSPEGSSIGVSGFLPGRVICQRPRVGDDFPALMNEVMRKHEVLMSTVLVDRRDGEMPKLAQLSRIRSQKICLTAIPCGLSVHLQEALATRPLAIPWEILPFHAGKIKLI